ncbi:MAG: hypothetical protein JNN07_00555 [Verrucomicrobiales bacterium]|nr:hypothetical protein [Verrucomicrobiales bacterium]
MKMSTRMIWWVLLAALVTTISIAWYFEHKFSRLLAEDLHRLGEDIVSNSKKWEAATMGGREPFFWWKDLNVGHGLTMQIVSVKQCALLGIALQLGITLGWTSRGRSVLKANSTLPP